MNNYLKGMSELTGIALENVNIEASEVDIYANSIVGEEMLAVDALEATQTAAESYAEAVVGATFAYQEIGLEAAGIEEGLAGYMNCFDMIGTEAVMDTIKSKASAAWKAVKNLAKKVVTMVMAVIDYFMGTDARFKSYGKLFKKYTLRITKANLNAGKADKTYKIGKYDALDAEITSFKNAVHLDSVKQATSQLKSANITSVAALKQAVNRVVVGVTVKAKAWGADLDAAQTDADLQEIIKSKAIGKGVAEQVKALSEKVRDKEDLSLEAAGTRMASVGTKLGNACDKDIKFKKEYRQFRETLTKKIDAIEIKGEGDAAEAEANELAMLNKWVTVLAQYRNALSKWYAGIASLLQAALNDMATVISAGTTIRG